jgi:hypothetical protein
VKDTAVEKWFDARSTHPLAPAMRMIRGVIMGADPRMKETVQYGTIQFVCQRGFANFVQVADRKRVTLMFNVVRASRAATRTSRATGRTRGSCASRTSRK